MTISAPSQRMRDWLSVAGAIAIGPAFQVTGYAGNFVFGAAAYFYFWVCACVIPLLVWSALRLRIAVWQIAVLSMALSVVGDNLRLHAIRGREMLQVGYGFWVLGTLLSSPFPLYLLLRPLPRGRKILAGIGALVVGWALYLSFGLFMP